MPNPPPLAPSGNPPPLRKFTLHPPSLTAPTSPLTLAANGSGAFSPAALQGLRQTLTQARTSAAERLAIRDGNRRNLADRQANEKRVAEEQARQKEVERKRKREEDERREKERVERAERERIEREREEGAKRKKEEEEYQMLKKQEEDDKQRKDEEERLAAIKRAREMKEKKRADEVFELVKANEEKQAREKAEAERVAAAAAAQAALPQEDVKMEDAPAEVVVETPTTQPSTSQPPRDLTPKPKPTVPSIAIASSPEAEDDFGQPKPPVRHHDKKKRKRDQIIDSDASDSDGEDSQPLLQKARKLDSKASTAGPTPSPTPHPNGTPRTLSFTLNGAPPPPPDDPYAGLSVIERKLKEDKFVKHSIPIRPPAPGNATAFYLPSHNLVPPKPVSVPQIPTPKRQSDVRGDFSSAKPGTQIAHHTFHTWAEAYLRPFGEDDLAFLAPKPEDITPYLIPPLGKHYTERWEEEDSNMPVASTSSYASPLEPPPLLRTRPEMLTEDASGAENVFLGPLSERLVAALAFQEEGEESDDEGAERERLREERRAGKEALNGMEGAMVQRKGQMDAVELEERIKRELRFIGILPDEDVDWTAREDDEVCSALRACQRELHHQTALNESRKVILTSIVKDRMAHQDYETTRDAQERIIENGWTKRQRSGKKKGKGKDREKGADGSKLPISLTLLEALDKRNKLVGSFRPFFEEEEDKGRFQGIPETSVYEGLEEMLRAEEEEDELALP